MIHQIRDRPPQLEDRRRRRDRTVLHRRRARLDRRADRAQAHVVVNGWTEIGEDCQLFPFATSARPRRTASTPESARSPVGSRTVLREYVSVQRATGHDEVTSVGDDCLLLAYVHIAHNCVVGNAVTMSNLAQLAGHVRDRRLRDHRRAGGDPSVHAHRALRDGRRHDEAHARTCRRSS